MCSTRRLAASAAAAAVLVAFSVCAEAGGGSLASLRGGEVVWPRGERTMLHARPGSRRLLATIAATTRFGSPTVLAVVGKRSGWLAVISDALSNGVRGWVRAGSVSLRHDPFALEVDLSRRRLTVWRAGVPERRLAVAVGSPSSPTPTGRFAITDKLAGFNPSVYGCCVLVLSGHQTHLPPGWQGGDQLAIHGGPGIGAAVSNGCLHAENANLHWLMARLPLGTQVIVHP